eukprot:COSAG06_NODE_24389_length_664_cov_1.100885_2_plen_59_part_01
MVRTSDSASPPHAGVTAVGAAGGGGELVIEQVSLTHEVRRSSLAGKGSSIWAVAHTVTL